MKKGELLIILLAMMHLLCNGQDNYGLIIGIKGYPEYKEGQKLQFADHDAEAFRDFITSPEGGSFKVKLLTNANATRTKIMSEIKEFGRQVKSQDRFFIFYSGHGEVDENGDAYFMPFDANPALLDDKGMEMRKFLEQITRKINAKMIVFFADACHSGSAFGAKGSDNRFSTLLNEQWSEIFKNRDNTCVVISSSGVNQSSYEDQGLKHGIFTYYLIEGLKGKADQTSKSPDGTVRAGELRSFLDERVGEHAKEKLHSWQNPIWSPNFDPDLPFSIYDVAKKNKDEFRSLFDSAWNANLKGKTEIAIELYREALKFNPRSANAYNNLGVCYEKQENYGLAQEAYQKAKSYSPTYLRAMRNIAILQENLGHTEKSMKECRAILKIARNDFTALNLLGGMYHDRLFKFDSSYYFNRLALKSKTTAVSIANLGESAFTLSQYQEADSLCLLLRDSSDVHSGIAVKFTQLANSIAWGKPDERNMLLFKDFITSLTAKMNTEKVNWNFSGSARYILGNESIPVRNKRMLLGSIQFMSTTKSKASIAEFLIMLPDEYVKTASVLR